MKGHKGSGDGMLSWLYYCQYPDCDIEQDVLKDATTGGN